MGRLLSRRPALAKAARPLRISLEPARGATIAGAARSFQPQRRHHQPDFELVTKSVSLRRKKLYTTGVSWTERAWLRRVTKGTGGLFHFAGGDVTSGRSYAV
jgi:hypothetical protein